VKRGIASYQKRANNAKDRIAAAIKQRVGHRFTANLETNLQVDDVIVAPRGRTVHGRLATAKPGSCSLPKESAAVEKGRFH
jgi:hypothetical protein